MIPEAVVNSETACLLASKGFSSGQPKPQLRKLVLEAGSFIEIPTQQTAMQWLSDIHNIEISVNVGWLSKGVKVYFGRVYIAKNGRNDYPMDDADEIMTPSRTLTIEKSIQWALKNLLPEPRITA